MTIREILNRNPELEPQLRTYYRNLPSLLAEQSQGRFAVVGRDRVSGTWDTYRDAMQHGLESFGPGEFLVQRIDPRLMDMLAVEFGPEPAACPA
jgi:hypothetical protein